MNSKSILIIAVISMMFFAMTGCASTKQTGAASSQVLFDARNKYIGDNSADLKLLGLLGIKDIGSYKIELQTSSEPYAMKITFLDIKPGIDEQKLNSEMKKDSALLIALIENAGKIEWAYTINGNEIVKSMTAGEASALIGKNVKSCGESIGGVEELISKLE